MHGASFFQKNRIGLLFVIATVLLIAFLYSKEPTESYDSHNRRLLSDCPRPDAVFFDTPFSKEKRKDGWIAFHFIVIVFLLLAMNTISNEYFGPCLSLLCEKFNLGQDVVGASIMAIGASIPELILSIISVFVSENNVGFGNIIGTANFNILIVPALCCLFMPELKLKWFPIVRNCICVGILLVAMAVIVDDGIIKWYESLIFVLLFPIWALILHVSPMVEHWAEEKLEDAHETHDRGEFAQLVLKIVDSIYFNVLIAIIIVLNITVVIMDLAGFDESDMPITLQQINLIFSLIFVVELVLKNIGYGVFGYWKDPYNSFEGALVLMIIVEFILSGTGQVGVARILRVIRLFRLFRLIQRRRNKAGQRNLEATDFYSKLHEGDVYGTLLDGSSDDASIQSKDPMQRLPVPKKKVATGPLDLAEVLPPGKVTAEMLEGGYQPLELTDKEAENVRAAHERIAEEEIYGGDTVYTPFKSPRKSQHAFLKLLWLLKLPFAAFFYYTIPDIRVKPEKWVITLLLSILWIGFLDYLLSWAVNTIGSTFDVRGDIVAIILLSICSGVPILLLSINAAQNKMPNMAFAGPTGSLVFILTLGLPVSWFIYSAIYHAPDSNSPVNIAPDSIEPLVISTLVLLFAFVLTTQYFKWKLQTKLGYALIFFYVLFVIQTFLLSYDKLDSLAPGAC